jgi:hypothetical protein
MNKLDEAVSSTKQRLEDAQASLVGTAVRATVQVQRQGFEQWLAVARKNRVAPPAPTRVVADVRQYFTDVAAIRKDTVEQLRDAWTPVYEAAAAKVTDGVVEVKERAVKLREQAASADENEKPAPADSDVVLTHPTTPKPPQTKNAVAKPAVREEAK